MDAARRGGNRLEERLPTGTPNLARISKSPCHRLNEALYPAVIFLPFYAGGVLGGISSGQDIVVSLALKPTSSITLPGATIDLHGAATEVITTGRHDPCVGIRATPIAEAMLALVLMDHYLRFRAQCGDVVRSTPVIKASV